MKAMKLLFLCAVTITAVPASHALAQVQTHVPEVVPGAKHLPPLEAPDEFDRLLLAFLTEDRI